MLDHQRVLVPAPRRRQQDRLSGECGRFEQVEEMLEQAGITALVDRAADDQGIGGDHPIDQRPQPLSTAATIATRSTTHRGTRSWLADLRETHRPGDSP